MAGLTVGVTTPFLKPDASQRWSRPREEAERLAQLLPPLLIAAEAVASSVALGVHGRRKAGMGETFWQFRHYRAEDPASAIDWRQSGKSQHLYVREREWEAAEAVRFWRDGAPGMEYASFRELPTKRERATVLALALATLLVRGGERIGLYGDPTPASTGRITLHRLALALSDEAAGAQGLPPPESAPGRHMTLIWLSDFLQPVHEIEARMRALAGAGIKGFLVQINDPAEEDFPFAGRLRFEAPPGIETSGLAARVFGRAETVRADYRAQFAAHVDSLGQAARKLDWSMTRHRTDHPSQTALIALYTALGGMRASRGF